VKAKKFEEGGKMYAGQEIEVKHPDLMAAVKQIQAAVKAAGTAPMKYEIKACYESEEE
jgi:uncharacterized protein YqgV (UPF0045/DUF77 family)